MLSEREALHRAVGSVVVNASNFPEKVQSRILGQDMEPLNEKIVDAVQAAGSRKVEVTDDMRLRAGEAVNGVLVDAGVFDTDAVKNYNALVGDLASAALSAALEGSEQEGKN